jgi:hypothetical protein
MAGNFFTSCDLLASQEGLSSMELDLLSVGGIRGLEGEYSMVYCKKFSKVFFEEY